MIQFHCPRRRCWHRLALSPHLFFGSGSRNRTPGPPPFSSMNSTSTALGDRFSLGEFGTSDSRDAEGGSLARSSAVQRMRARAAVIRGLHKLGQCGGNPPKALVGAALFSDRLNSDFRLT
jgi:hypothetical protein